MPDPLNNLKESLDQLLQVDTSIKRKNKKIYDQKKELFINLITQFEQSITRSYLMEKDFNVDLSKYEEGFYQVIDSLILLAFGKQIYEILSFYFYDRYNPDGNKNSIVIQETEEEIELDTVEDLWNIVISINPDIFNEKG